MAIGAVCGAVVAVVALFVLMFIAGGVSAGMFIGFLEQVFGYFFGEHWMVILFSLGAVAGAILGARRAS